MNGLRLLITSQKGSGAVELLLITAFILVPAAMLLLGLPALLEYRSLGDAAAREAARACAIAPDGLGKELSLESMLEHFTRSRTVIINQGTPDPAIDA